MERRSNGPLVKICGITRPEDAESAVAAGADFIGIVFHPASPRHVDRSRALELAWVARRAESGCLVVGVFVDLSAREINDVADFVGLDLVQLHGHEDEATIAEIHRPVIKAIRVESKPPDPNRWPGAEWILFDTFAAGAAGGTGRSFDWSLIEGLSRERKVFLSGGINSGNVSEAMTRVAPDALDVSSGVEDAPGIKNSAKIERFFEVVRGQTRLVEGERRGEG